MSASNDFSHPLKTTEFGAVAEVTANSCAEPNAVDSIPEDDQPVCWICLETGAPNNALIQPCKCPRLTHPTCLARWQLQSAGTTKETHCEWCNTQMPDWKKTLTPNCGADAPAVMNVNFNDRTFSFQVKPGPEGYQQFTEAIRRAFGLPEDSELNITFTCDEPVVTDSGVPDIPEVVPPFTPSPAASMSRPDSAATSPMSPSSAALLTLQGAGAYDAAVHCASVSAAKRMSQSGTPPQSPQGVLRQGYNGDLGHSTIPYSTIPGYTPQLNQQMLQQTYRSSVAQGATGRPAADFRRPFAMPPAPATRHFPNLMPQIHDSQLSVPRRNNGSSMLQRATKAVRKFTGRKDKD